MKWVRIEKTYITSDTRAEFAGNGASVLLFKFNGLMLKLEPS